LGIFVYIKLYMEFEKLEIILRWPHQGIVVGFEQFESSEEYPFYTLRIHLSIISLSLDLKPNV
jgi:hypothetical protein